jgi:hypothetical protein
MSAIDIARGLTQLRPDWNIDGPYQFGEIGAVGAHGANTVDVYLDGSTSLSTGLYYSADYGPQVNDPVMIGRMQGSSQSARVVLGPLAPGGTIHGGPPTSTPYVGARIFDTKYGVTWWYDGSTWNANGPGLITARMHLASTSYNPGTSAAVFVFDTVTFDPLGLCVTGASAHITVPIAGRYRLSTAVKCGGSSSTVCPVIYTGGGAVMGFCGNIAPSVYAGNGIAVTQTLAAGTAISMQITQSVSQNMQVDSGTTGANNFLQVEFVSS